MVPQRLVSGLTAWAILSPALATPSPESLASDVYLLLHNDLLGAPGTHDAALVLGNLQTHDEAVSSCAALGEGLWEPPTAHNASAEIGLSYLAYADPSTRVADYWIQKAAAGTCRAITSDGVVHNRDCSTNLAVLCANSAALAVANTTDTSSQWHTTVKTGNLTLTGYRDKHSFRFLGIRYAAQPERFTHSTLYSGPASASALDFSPLCIQTDCNATTCAEDCLFLNVWTPYLPKDSASQSSKLKPVLFWIHGGGFTGGLGSDPTTDGGNMASRGDVVVVTFNYRVSTLGFLALGNNQTNGNYGLGDQVTALDWVRQHIADFGGDPEKITIMGQSAGGASVRALMASPRAKGKFRNAIPMSAPLGVYPFQSYGDYYSVQGSASLFGDAILSIANCTRGTKDALKCLRAYDPYELVALPDVASSLVVDGFYLTSSSLNLTAPSGPSIPLLTGSLHDDAASFTPWPSANSTLSSILASYGIPALPSILSAFPTNSSSNTTLALFNATSRLATDASFRCLNLASVLTGARHRVFNPSSTFIYEVDRSYMPPAYNPNPLACDAPVTSAHPSGDPTAAYYKCHGGELLFVFGNLVFNELPFRDDEDVLFSRYMLDRFAAFIRTGDVEPAKAFLEARGFSNEDGVKNVGFTWKKLDLQNPSFARLDWPPTTKAFDEKAQCESFGSGLDYYENGGA